MYVAHVFQKKLYKIDLINLTQDSFVTIISSGVTQILSSLNISALLFLHNKKTIEKSFTKVENDISALVFEVNVAHFLTLQANRRIHSKQCSVLLPTKELRIARKVPP